MWTAVEDFKEPELITVDDALILHAKTTELLHWLKKNLPSNPEAYQSKAFYIAQSFWRNTMEENLASMETHLEAGPHKPLAVSPKNEEAVAENMVNIHSTTKYVRIRLGQLQPETLSPSESSLNKEFQRKLDGVLDIYHDEGVDLKGRTALGFANEEKKIRNQALRGTGLMHAGVAVAAAGSIPGAPHAIIGLGGALFAAGSVKRWSHKEMLEDDVGIEREVTHRVLAEMLNEQRNTPRSL